MAEKSGRLEFLKLASEEAERIALGGITNFSNEPLMAKRMRASYVSNNPISNAHLNAFSRAMGNKARGNRRHKNSENFYMDLIICFFHLKELGEKLPRYWLSKRQAQKGIYEVLFKHGYVKVSLSEFALNAHLRESIRHNLERVFVRIAAAVENENPPQI